MTNKSKRRPPREVQLQRPLHELKFTAVIRPPDGDRDPDTGQPRPVELEVELRTFTLYERQFVKTVMNLFALPHDTEDIVVAHAFVVWKRTHPTASLKVWMEHIEWGQFIEDLTLDPKLVNWDTTPPDFDPKVFAPR